MGWNPATSLRPVPLAVKDRCVFGSGQDYESLGSVDNVAPRFQVRLSLAVLRVGGERTHGSGEEQRASHYESAEGIREVGSFTTHHNGLPAGWVEDERLSTTSPSAELRDTWVSCTRSGFKPASHGAFRRINTVGARETEDRTLIFDGDGAILREPVHSEKHLIP